MITGPRDTVKRARKLRSEMSMPEAMLWRELRKRPGSYKFRRQHPAGRYVLDFYCAEAKLDVEIDGWAHDNAGNRLWDARRSGYLLEQEIATTRIPARRILDELEGVVMRLVEICDMRTEQSRVPLHQPSVGPPPRSGEDA